MNLNTKQFDARNAYALAAMSRHAYAEADLSIPETDTHCLVVEADDCIAIVFRGTDSIRDWITDVDFLREELLTSRRFGRAEVHSGFLQAYQSILGALTDRLRVLADGHLADGHHSTKPIFVAGHSLGGALALLAALELERQGFEIAQVYTYGQPRLGNRAFCRVYNAALGDRTYRVVYQEDIVPRVPHLPAVTDWYRHCGTEVFIPSVNYQPGKDLWMNPPWWRVLMSDAWGIWRAFCLNNIGGALDPVRDHHIVNYCEALAPAPSGCGE